jgi:hypothetical protein
MYCIFLFSFYPLQGILSRLLQTPGNIGNLKLSTSNYNNLVFLGDNTFDASTFRGESNINNPT